MNLWISATSKSKTRFFLFWSKDGLLGSKEFINLEIDSEEFKRGAEALKDAIAIHHVVEGNYVKPILKGTWATGPLKVTQEASAGKKLSPQEIQQLAEVKRLQVLDTKAKDLLNLINICITTGKYAVPTSAQYGLDKLYASDKLIAPSDVIDKATDTWVLGSGEPGCTSEFKNELKFRLRNETDFMKSIVPGETDKGKHNVHVIHVNAALKIIATPLFETTIERKIRLGQKIKSDWYSPGDKISGKVPYAPGQA